MKNPFRMLQTGLGVAFGAFAVCVVGALPSFAQDCQGRPQEHFYYVGTNTVKVRVPDTYDAAETIMLGVKGIDLEGVPLTPAGLDPRMGFLADINIDYPPQFDNDDDGRRNLRIQDAAGSQNAFIRRTHVRSIRQLRGAQRLALTLIGGPGPRPQIAGPGDLFLVGNEEERFMVIRLGKWTYHRDEQRYSPRQVDTHPEMCRRNAYPGDGLCRVFQFHLTYDYWVSRRGDGVLDFSCAR